MSLQYSVTVRNAQLDVVESTIGTTPVITFFSGSPPANCAAADTGTVLDTFALPSDWMAAASSGSKAKSGTWTMSGDAAGTIGHFRIKDSSGTTCHLQGTVTATGGGGDMTMDNVVIAVGQAGTVNTFTLNAGNA